MTGSPLVPVLVPIVALICLGAWIALVFYADSHPGWRHRRSGAGGGQAVRAGQPDSQEAAPPASPTPPAPPVPPARRAA